MLVATEIKTEDWNRIIQGLVDEGWQVKMKYDAFDAGIDFDFLILKYDKQEIIFGWDNWVEGEIKCPEELMNSLSSKFNVNFQFGDPVNLKPRVILLTKAQILASRL